jgi:hypothetical protein
LVVVVSAVSKTATFFSCFGLVIVGDDEDDDFLSVVVVEVDVLVVVGIDWQAIRVQRRKLPRVKYCPNPRQYI